MNAPLVKNVYLRSMLSQEQTNWCPCTKPSSSKKTEMLMSVIIVSYLSYFNDTLHCAMHLAGFIKMYSPRKVSGRYLRCSEPSCLSAGTFSLNTKE